MVAAEEIAIYIILSAFHTYNGERVDKAFPLALQGTWGRWYG